MSNLWENIELEANTIPSNIWLICNVHQDLRNWSSTAAKLYTLITWLQYDRQQLQLNNSDTKLSARAADQMLTPVLFLQWCFGTAARHLVWLVLCSTQGSLEWDSPPPKEKEKSTSLNFCISAHLLLLYQLTGGFSTWKAGTPAHDTQLFTVVAYHGCSHPWASMA